jgi:polyribonucleotide nucleotidyltransferase
VNVGDKLRVEIADIDARGKVSLVPIFDEEAGGEAAPDSGSSGGAPAQEPEPSNAS